MDLFQFEVSLVYVGSFKSAKITQRDLVSLLPCPLPPNDVLTSKEIQSYFVQNGKHSRVGLLPCPSVVLILLSQYSFQGLDNPGIPQSMMLTGSEQNIVCKVDEKAPFPANVKLQFFKGQVQGQTHKWSTFQYTLLEPLGLGYLFHAHYLTIVASCFVCIL